MRPGLYSVVYGIEAVEKYRGISFRINENQEDFTAFQEMSVSKWAKVTSAVLRRLATHFTIIPEGTLKDWSSSSFRTVVRLRS